VIFGQTKSESLPWVWVGPVRRHCWHSRHIGLWREEEENTKQTLQFWAGRHLLF